MFNGVLWNIDSYDDDDDDYDFTVITVNVVLSFYVQSPLVLRWHAVWILPRVVLLRGGHLEPVGFCNASSRCGAAFSGLS